MLKIAERVERWMRHLHTPSCDTDAQGTDWGLESDLSGERNKRAHEAMLDEIERTNQVIREAARVSHR